MSVHHCTIAGPATVHDGMVQEATWLVILGEVAVFVGATCRTTMISDSMGGELGHDMSPIRSTP